jgi:phosphoribosylformylglycinamidine synthase
MAFAARSGLRLELQGAEDRLLPRLFSEELGAVLQVRGNDLDKVYAICREEGLGELLLDLGCPVAGAQLEIQLDDKPVLELDLADLHQCWSRTSYAIQRLRDNPECADEEFNDLGDWSRPGLQPRLGFEPGDDPAAPMVATGARPAVAILREQGVNGHVEMAAAFHQAGFRAVDVHMSDIVEGRFRLDEFHGFVACGGFSFGDVLGAGRGWASSILLNALLRDQFEDFLADAGRFALGVCNGCQMLSALRELIPGSSSWPDFVRNRSEQFEARLSQVLIEPSRSLFFEGMQGSVLMVPTAHGEGRADYGQRPSAREQVVLRYVDGHGQAVERYPENPNGSPEGITGLCNDDGRVTVMMPHPERTLRTVNFSWAPSDWGPVSPWQRMFRNARAWLG